MDGLISPNLIPEEALDPKTARVIADARAFFRHEGLFLDLCSQLLAARLAREKEELDKFARPLLSIMTEQEIFRAFQRVRTDCDVLLIRI